VSADRSKLQAAEQQLLEQQAELERLRQQLQVQQAASPSSTTQKLQALLMQKDRDIQRLQQLLQEQQQQQVALQEQLQQRQIQLQQLQQQQQQLQGAAAAPATAAGRSIPAVQQQQQQQDSQQELPVASPEQLQRLLRVQSSSSGRSNAALANSSSTVRAPASYSRSMSGAAARLSFSEQDVWPRGDTSHQAAAAQPTQQQEVQAGPTANRSLLTPAHLQRSLHHSSSSTRSSFASRTGSDSGSSKQLSIAASRAQALPLEGPSQQHLEALGLKTLWQQPADQSSRDGAAVRGLTSTRGSAAAVPVRNSRREGQSQLVAAALLAESSESDVERHDTRRAAQHSTGGAAGREASRSSSLLTESATQRPSQLMSVVAGGYDAEQLRRSLSGTAGSRPDHRVTSAPGSAAAGASAGPGASLTRASSVSSSVRPVLKGSVHSEPSSLQPSRAASMAQRAVSFKAERRDGPALLTVQEAAARASGGGGGGGGAAAAQAGVQGAEGEGTTQGRQLRASGSLTGSRRQQEAVLQKAAALLADDSD